jgi:outer membrane protein OmpA-like peptidoglycan-associated protein
MGIPAVGPRRAAVTLAALLAWPAIGTLAAGPGIPLCPGLTIVTAIAQPEGDYESIKTIGSVDPTAVHMRYSTERVQRELAGHPLQRIKVTRTIHRDDLRTATRYLQEFGYSTPTDVPGTTALGTSSAVLRRLKETGSAELAVFDLPGGFASEKPYPTDRNVHPNLFDHEVVFKLRRVEAAPVMLPVIVNDQRVELPAVHAAGAAEWGEKGEFYFLDDEDNPLSLRWRIRTSNVSTADRQTLQVVRISYDCKAAPGPSALETALAERGRADVYEIFFDFNSDEIREESEPTLAEIADILRRHGDWKLGVEGHTDGIASDAFNLDLSKRRAAAVKRALVGRYRIDASRLTTDGYGKSRPKDTNATPEGRARNRRVELVRQ